MLVFVQISIHRDRINRFIGGLFPEPLGDRDLLGNIALLYGDDAGVGRGQL